MRMCGCVWVVIVNRCVHWNVCVHVMQLLLVHRNCISHFHPAIQQRTMDVRGSATNYLLYIDERGCASSPWCSISSPLSFSFFVIHVLSVSRKKSWQTDFTALDPHKSFWIKFITALTWLKILFYNWIIFFFPF